MHAALTVKLNEILAEPTPSKFIDELGDFTTDPNIGGVVPENLKAAPLLVKGVIFVGAFYLTAASSGIYGWLEELYDDYPNLAGFFDRIKARSAAAYIRSALRLFPKASILKDPDKRFEFCDQNEDTLRRLDRKYEKASEAALDRLRRHLISHRREFEEQVEAFWELRKRHHELYEKRRLERWRQLERKRSKKRR